MPAAIDVSASDDTPIVTRLYRSVLLREQTGPLLESERWVHAFAAHQPHNRGRMHSWGRESMFRQPMKTVVANMLSRPGISGSTFQIWMVAKGTGR